MSVDTKEVKIDDVRQLVSGLEKIILNFKTFEEECDRKGRYNDDENQDCKVQSVQCSMKTFAKCANPSWESYLSREIIQDAYKYLKYFRLDAFGNLVCARFSEGGVSMNRSMCFYDMDHIMPKANGGLDLCDVNARVLYWFTNRKKQNKLDKETPTDTKEAGLRLEDIAEIFKYIHEKNNKEAQARHTLYKLAFTAVNTQMKWEDADLAKNMKAKNPEQKLAYIITLYVKSIDSMLENMHKKKDVY